MNPDAHWIRPEWPAPPGVHVVSTLRTGGTSVGPYASFNLAAHVGDAEEHVAANRKMLGERAHLPDEPLWLEQVHGKGVVLNDGRRDVPRADASIALGPGRVCVVMTADCLPVVLADRAGTCVGMAHAGWRGLAGGVLQATISAMDRDPANLLAWLGPAIGQSAFEVGPEVREAFLEQSPRAGTCFAANERGRYQADLYGLARILLAAAGVPSVHGGGWCTASDRERFFSFRRDGTTGRMATLAWLA
ncbi:MAG: peptidoglycan editing factor PgeF [Gammaproteobacteria bacterium]|nr:peptidoglycan editing factor PgeF [Gammaproteobacteria bacterium]